MTSAPIREPSFVPSQVSLKKIMHYNQEVVNMFLPQKQMPPLQDGLQKGHWFGKRSLFV